MSLLGNTSNTDHKTPNGVPIALVFGTRPEIVKLAPVARALGTDVRLIHTGQHFTSTLSDLFLAECGLGAPDIQLAVGGASRGRQIADALRALDELFAAERPAAVVVQGDTNAVAAAALAANARAVPLVHVEAGLRSHDRAMPEEHNRIVADHLADLCCAPTEMARANLAQERIEGDRVVVTGNTVVDAVRAMLPDADDRVARTRTLGVTPNEFVLATFHRPENVDDAEHLEIILDELGRIPMPVLLPLHPRTAARLETLGHDVAANVRLLDPVGYRDFLALARECAVIVSDSGGVQEEASVLGRPVIVVRRSTERPELLGTFSELVAVGPGISALAREWTADVQARHERLEAMPTPYGDGHAGEATARAIRALLSR